MNKYTLLANNISAFRFTLLDGHFFGPLKLKGKLFEAIPQALDEPIMVHGTNN